MSFKKARTIAPRDSDSDSDENQLVSLIVREEISTAAIKIDSQQVQRLIGCALLSADRSKPKDSAICSLVEPLLCTDEHLIVDCDVTTQQNFKQLISSFRSSSSTCSDLSQPSPVQSDLPTFTLQTTHPTNNTISNLSNQTYLSVLNPPSKISTISPRYNKLQGVISFDNATVFFVNLDKSNYNNQFAFDATFPDSSNPALGSFGLSFYASPSQTYDSKQIKHILQSINPKITPSQRPQLYLCVREECSSAKLRAADPIKNQYVFWGPVEIMYHGYTATRQASKETTEKDVIEFLLRPTHLSALLSSLSWLRQVNGIQVTNLPARSIKTLINNFNANANVNANTNANANVNANDNDNDEISSSE